MRTPMKQKLVNEDPGDEWAQMMVTPPSAGWMSTTRL